MMALRRIVLLSVCLALPLSAAGQSVEDVVRSYTGKKLILRYFGGTSAPRVKKKDLARQKGGADIAVEVLRAEWKKDSARFQLERIGRLVLLGKPIVSRFSWNETPLIISGFDKSDSPDEVARAIDQLLQTPEAYLAAQGVKFDYPPMAPDTPVAQAKSGFKAPRTLLGVNAAYPGSAARNREQALVLVAIVVGTDGLVHDAKLIRRSEPAFEQAVLRVMSLYRFEPARDRDTDRPIAVRVPLEMNFRIL